MIRCLWSFCQMWRGVRVFLLNVRGCWWYIQISRVSLIYWKCQDVSVFSSNVSGVCDFYLSFYFLFYFNIYIYKVRMWISLVLLLSDRIVFPLFSTSVTSNVLCCTWFCTPLYSVLHVDCWACGSTAAYGVLNCEWNLLLCFTALNVAWCKNLGLEEGMSVWVLVFEMVWGEYFWVLSGKFFLWKISSMDICASCM